MLLSAQNNGLNLAPLNAQTGLENYFTLRKINRRKLPHRSRREQATAAGGFVAAWSNYDGRGGSNRGRIRSLSLETLRTILTVCPAKHRDYYSILLAWVGHNTKSTALLHYRTQNPVVWKDGYI